ncbi:MAG TPA: hypothetical protein VMT20_10805 [Terriglobia bacterium]|nr:hypothetical protein [Terriglobia bacterium]
MRTSICTAVAFVIPAALYAQLGGLSGGPSPYGNGVQAVPSYTGTTGPSNVLLVSVNSVASYDNNVLGISQSQMGDEILGLGPRIAFFEQHGPAGFEIDYQPYFQFYQHLSQYNHINQTLAANVTFALGSHLSLQLRDAFSDQTGTYQTESSQPLVPGLGSPTALNGTIYTPFSPERNNNARLDLIYRGSSRTSVSFFGGYSQLKFTGEPATTASLLDTLGYTGGMQYTYRLSGHATLGLLYTFQVYQYQGSVPVGSSPRTAVHSGIVSLAWKATPSVSLQVFGGPQYLPAHQLVTAESTGSAPANTNAPGLWSWTAGGSVSKSTEKTSLQLAAGRAVTDGGGLLATLTSAYATLGLNRRLIRRWSGSCAVTGSQGNTLDYGFGTGKINSLSGTAGLEHAFRESFTTRLSYTYTRQYATGSVPYGSNLNHSIVSLTISYQLPKIPLGR